MDLKEETQKIEPLTDPRIYRSPWTPPITSRRYLKGTDLLVHEARDGECLYYFCHWSLDGVDAEQSFQVVTKEDARLFLIRVAGHEHYGNMYYDEVINAKKHFPELFEE